MIERERKTGTERQIEDRGGEKSRHREADRR